jgi:hypothetical protein
MQRYEDGLRTRASVPLSPAQLAACDQMAAEQMEIRPAMDS